MKKIFFTCASLLIFGLFINTYAMTEEVTGEIIDVENIKAFRIGLQAIAEV